MSAIPSLGFVIENSITLLCEMITVGEAADTKPNIEMRRCLVTVVHSLPICCRDLLAEAKQHDSWEPVLFYERIRVGISSKSYFLEGVPTSIALFAGPSGLSLAGEEEEKLAKLKMKDVLADRTHSVALLESYRPATPRKKELIRKYHPEDLPASVPGPVRVLIARQRSLCKGMRQRKDGSHFTHCCNCNCNRIFYIGAPNECWGVASTSTVGGLDDEEDSNSEKYWEMAACDSSIDTPSMLRFCSSTCSDEYYHHLSIMMPDYGIVLDADNEAKKHGRKRVAESFRLALKRNEKAARALRTLRSSRPRNLALTPEELNVHIQRRITMLNVDLGVLYAASKIAESETLSKGRLLPGQCLYWRDDPAYYRKILAGVSRIYMTKKRKEGIVSSLLTMPRFLEEVEARAYKLI